MAKERKASVIYDGNASQLTYAFPFDYLRKAFVKVEDIYTSITELEQGTDYTVSDKEVVLTKGIPIGHSVKIYRETTTDPLVEWQDASVLKSDDLTLQEVQLLHLAEETADKVFDSGMSTAYGNPNAWDGQYKRIINALDPIEDGDLVTLRYIKANQSSLLNALKSEGAKQNESIVSTGNTQNTRLTTTGDTQNKRLTDTGNSYVSTMTTLKNTATTKATEASDSAELSKKWAMSSTSPDGVAGNKSSKTWAEEAKSSASASATSASNSATSATASATSATKAATSEANAKSSETNAKASETAAKSSQTSAKTSETNAAASAKAAAQSEANAKTWDPTQYAKITDVNTKISDTYKFTDTVSIGKNTDLNTLSMCRSPMLRCALNTTVATLKNCPTNKAFVLINHVSSDDRPIFADTNTTYVLRTIIAIDNNVYQSSMNKQSNGTITYTSWVQLAPKSAIPTKLSQLTNDIAVSSGTCTRKLGTSGELKWYKYGRVVNLQLTSGLKGADLSSAWTTYVIFTGAPKPIEQVMGSLSIDNYTYADTYPQILSDGRVVIQSRSGAIGTKTISNLSITYISAS